MTYRLTCLVLLVSCSGVSAQEPAALPMRRPADSLDGPPIVSAKAWVIADGKTGLLPVLDAQRSYARASMAVVRARAQRLQDTAALLYAVSRNWDRANTTEPKRTDIAGVAVPNPPTGVRKLLEGQDKGR